MENASCMRWTPDWCLQYLITAVSIISVLSDPRETGLGSLGAHYLEHFFGAIERNAGRDESHTRFVNTVIDTITEKRTSDDFRIGLIASGRTSDGRCTAQSLGSPAATAQKSGKYLKTAVGVFELAGRIVLDVGQCEKLDEIRTWGIPLCEVQDVRKGREIPFNSQRQGNCLPWQVQCQAQDRVVATLGLFIADRRSFFSEKV